ncbi:MAG TPA: hypothetical protein VFB44_06685 [Thermoleophilaceae bacterium]|nr:hypothetical protein [Thermoleophilaceae bacterium]
MPIARTRIPLILIALLALALPAGADAAQTRKKSIWGPAEVNGVSQFPIYKDLGVGIWQDRINWSDVAPRRPANPRDPSDPAYRWPAELGPAIAEARRFGIRTALVLSQAPRWANGHRDTRFVPRRPKDFADFAYAASARYPSVRLWLIWSEPTRRENYRPLISERRDRPLTRKMKRAPRTYARILDASYASLKSRSRRNLVIGGNTFTTGHISARNWIRNLRLPNGKPPRLDLYGHNPFSARRPLLNRPPLGHGFADFSDLDLLAKWVDRWLGRPRGKRGIKLFLSELFWPTDQPNHEFNFWVTRRTAASWLTDALRITRRWPRIYTLGWYSLYDDPPNEDGDEVLRGLLTDRGRKKPAYWAYKRG